MGLHIMATVEQPAASLDESNSSAPPSNIDCWVSATELLAAIGNYIGYDALVFLGVRALNLGHERGYAEGWRGERPIESIGWFQGDAPKESDGKPIVRAW